MRAIAIVREASWLTAQRASAYAIMLALTLAGAAAWVAHMRFAQTGPSDATDFIPFYAAGTMVREGHAAAAYHLDALTAVESRFAILGHGRLPFMYPPVLLVLCGWIAALPPAWAYIVFECLGLAPLLFCLWRILPRPWGTVPLLAAPALLMNFGSGQTGFFSAAAFAGGAVLIGNAPVLAGMCLGVLVFKPHLALMVPVVLAASGRWRAVFSCGVTAAVLCASSLLALGPESWTAFAAQAVIARHVLEVSSTAALIISPFGAMHAAGAGLAAAYAVQLVCGIACVALAAWTAFQRPAGAATIAVAASGALFATPYAMDYDLAVLLVPAVWLVAQARATGWRPWEKSVLAAVCLMPLFTRALVIVTGFQPAPLLTGAFLLLLCSRALHPVSRGAAHGA